MAYDSMKLIFKDPKKTQLKLILSRFLMKLWIPIIIVLFFSIQEVLVIALWMSVLNRHPRPARVMSILWNILDENLAKIEKRLYSQPASRMILDTMNIQSSIL